MPDLTGPSSVREIPGAVGRLEVLFDLPDGDPRAAVVLAHPLPTQGGTMHTRMVYQAAKGLARAGCVVMRFNFRGVGRSSGAFDDGKGERDDFAAALNYVASSFPGLEIWAGGASFGSFVGMTVGATDPRVSVLIGVAPPVGMRDFGAVERSTKPKFLVHGEADDLIPLKTVREFYARMEEPKELVVIDRADHLFDGQASEVGDALEDLLGDFQASNG